MKLKTLYKLQKEVPKSIEVVYYDLYNIEHTITYYTKDIIPDCVFEEEIKRWYCLADELTVYL